MRFAVTGEISRDRLSQPGLPAWEGLGGCALYLALALGRLGAEVTLASVAGDDLDAAWLEPLRVAGVDLRLRRLPGSTARLELAHDRQGDIARLRFAAGVERCLDAAHLPPDFWPADWIVVGTAPRAYQADVIGKADRRLRGVPRVALSTQREFQGDWNALAALLPHLDAIFTNSGEVVDWRGDRLPEGLAALRAANPRLTCLVTCGPRGALLLHEDRLHQVAACPAVVVNTTGGGDAFAAAWLSTLAHTGDSAQALRAASAAAALALGGMAHTRLPRRDEIEDKLAGCGASLRVEDWPADSPEAQAALAEEDAHCHRSLDRQVRRT